MIVPNPVLTEEELMVIRDTSFGPWHAAVLDTTFDLEEASAAKFKKSSRAMPRGLVARPQWRTYHCTSLTVQQGKSAFCTVLAQRRRCISTL